MTVRPIDANIAMKKIREYMEDFPNASTRLATCRSILSMLGDENQIPTLTPPNEWISVEDRLPENDAPVGRKQITVLVCSKAKKVSVASRIYEPEREYSGKVYPARWRWSKLMNKYVTHWMPLPAPPDSRQPEGEEDTK